jgi:exosortase/archaeosortase family protein
MFLFRGSAISLVEACIGGSAYFLLFLLVLSTADISIFKRLKVLAFSFVSFLALNVLRIVLMALLIGTEYFPQIHLLFWYFISIVFVVLIWFSAVKLFKISSIPVYSDLKFLIKIIQYKHVR